MGEVSPTRRFSDRVSDYVRARPGYPPAVLDALRERVGLREGWRVADVGAGTGISSRLFLDAGCEVFAIEPNDAMRDAASAQLGADGRFHAVNGTAEATTLPAESVDLVVAAQAFHWFDRERFRAEATRILRPSGAIALLWNDRQTGGTPFLEAYERLLHAFGTDYVSVNHRNIGAASIAAFFAPAACETITLPSAQRFDFDGLRARLLSSSYAPNVDSPRCGPMLAELRRIFDATQDEGVVEMVYQTQLFVGVVK